VCTQLKIKILNIKATEALVPLTVAAAAMALLCSIAFSILDIVVTKFLTIFLIKFLKILKIAKNKENLKNIYILIYLHCF